MLIKGEKYACEACVRGHRVTNCQHSDRPLQHINKKGRPVSQCQHCRTLRKSRSAHVRCECGEKGHSKGACTHDGESHADNCCCSHGGRCSCSLKKEHLDPVPESDSDESSLASLPVPEIRRPRAQTEGGLTIFTNGHHKPVKHNNMAHKCGTPYSLPRAHSIHGSSPSGLANRSVDNLPHTNTIDALHSESHIKDSIVSAQKEQRMVKSEHGSPHVKPASNFEQLNGFLPPLEIAASLPGDYTFLQNYDNFTSIADHDQPLFSAGLLSAASVDWSHYDGLDFNNDGFATSSYSQAASFNGFDFNGLEQPALTTTSTSGEISEVEDFPAYETAAARPSLLNNQYGSDFDVSDLNGETDGYRLSTASSYIRLPQAQLLATNSSDTNDMDSFLKSVGPVDGFTNQGMPVVSFDAEIGKSAQISTDLEDNNTFLGLSADEDNDVFWMNDYTSNTISINPPPSETYGENVWVQ
ncbi:hypothetical protein B0O99DRAFT_501571 [Bisporella sp. PMI_857]|nr:hypothetical protein B0O99DRAFT_501571 [Bisporella sp. PMI_857]